MWQLKSRLGAAWIIEDEKFIRRGVLFKSILIVTLSRTSLGFRLFGFRKCTRQGGQFSAENLIMKRKRWGRGNVESKRGDWSRKSPRGEAEHTGLSPNSYRVHQPRSEAEVLWATRNGRCECTWMWGPSPVSTRKQNAGFCSVDFQWE